jgi:hypothetical protein
MRRSLLGVLVGSFLVLLATADPGSSEQTPAGPQQFALPARAPSLITHVTAAEGQPQVVTVIDADERVMAVYHVDRTTGEITLKSVRNMTWDLQMLEFNSGEPLPQEIREMRRGLKP